MSAERELETMSDEQAADLARLEMLAGQGEPGPESQAEQDGPPPADPVESLAGVFTIGAYLAGSIGYKRVEELWQPETCRGLAEKTVPVLLKYPWGQRAIEFLTTGAGVEEVALALYAFPLAVATMKAANADAAAMKAKKKPEREQGPDEGVIEGQAVPETEAGQAGPDMAWAA